ncbi:MAG: nucleotidyltransferase family protein [Polyangiaceae bacterium]
MPDAALQVARERAHHEHARLVLGRTIETCRSGGVDVLPVKGVLTARTFYADTGERPIQDIDLRVRPRDMRAVREIGERAGWRLLSESRAYHTLSFDVLGFLVEFECHVGPPGLCGLRVEDMLQRSLPCTEPFGWPHLQPELHDHALLFCVNVFKDKLIEAMPGAVRDLELVAEHPGFSAGRLVALARDSGSANIVWIVAEWLAKTRGAERWRAVCDALGRSPPRPFYTFLFNGAIQASPPPRQVLRVLARVGSDRGGAQVRALGTMMALMLGASRGAWAAIANGGALRGNEGGRGKR